MKFKNYSFEEPPFKDNDVIDGGNFSQLEPDTEICKSIKDLIVNGGNFVNCKPQPSWTVNGGNWAQISFCTHVRPELISRGLIQCASICEHRSKNEIEREIDEQEYRNKKAQLANVSIDKVVDGDGVTVQVFKVTEYKYEQKKIKNNKPKTVKEIS